MRGYSIESSLDMMSYGFTPTANSNKLLLIKTGTDGSIYGYHNKYLHIAACFTSQGYSVLCCNTPSELQDTESFQLTMRIAKMHLGSRFETTEISYLGISRGAYQGILFGNRQKEISQLLLLNSPLPFNFLKQTSALRNVTKPHWVVFGTQDPSYKLYPFLEKISKPHLHLLSVPNADHHFSNHTQLFLTLPQAVFIDHTFP